MRVRELRDVLTSMTSSQDQEEAQVGYVNNRKRDRKSDRQTDRQTDKQREEERHVFFDVLS